MEQDMQMAKEIFPRLQERIRQLQAENQKLRDQLAAVDQEKLQQHLADMEVINLVNNTPKPVELKWKRGFFGFRK